MQRIFFRQLFDLYCAFLLFSCGHLFSLTGNRIVIQISKMGKISDSSNSGKLYRAVPVNWLWLPKPIRMALGWIYLVIFSLCFFSLVFALILLVPAFWRRYPLFAAGFAVSLIISLMLPAREWLVYL